MFDRLEIGQIINNLLSNAIKYNHDGGEVKIETYAEGNKVKVSVKR